MLSVPLYDIFERQHCPGNVGPCSEAACFETVIVAWSPDCMTSVAVRRLDDIETKLNAVDIGMTHVVPTSHAKLEDKAGVCTP